MEPEIFVRRRWFEAEADAPDQPTPTPARYAALPFVFIIFVIEFQLMPVAAMRPGAMPFTFYSAEMPSFFEDEAPPARQRHTLL